MQNSNNKKFKNNQGEQLEEIRNYLLGNRIVNEYFMRYKILCGNGRYNWLKWLYLEFVEDLKLRLYPYIGLQIYLYAVNINDIGIKISTNVKEKDKQINEFPNDYDLGKPKFYLIGKDMDIDLITGNIIKRDYTCSLLQICFAKKE